jgi:hypothetical protein
VFLRVTLLFHLHEGKCLFSSRPRITLSGSLKDSLPERWAQLPQLFLLPYLPFAVSFSNKASLIADGIVG